VQGLGAMIALHRAQPDWRLTLVTQDEYLPLLQGFAGLHRVVGFRRRAGWSGLAAVWRQLRTDRYDIALDLQGNWKSAMIACLSGARQRLGAAAAWRQEPASACLLHRRVTVPGHPHPALVAHTLASELVPMLPFSPPRLTPQAAEVAAEAVVLLRLGVAPDRPFRLLVVTDPRDPRALRPEVLNAELAAAPLPSVVLFGPAEAHLAPPDHVPVLRHGTGEVRRLVALGALLAMAGGEVLGPDQGACHVLAAAGARCRVMFGAQDPRRTAPPEAIALGHPEPPTCAPCRRTACSHPDGPVCMAFLPSAGRILSNDLPLAGD
jgi:heptosyltransferase-1